MCEIKVLDGGFSTQLALHVGDKIDGDPLWTARFLATKPEAVYKTHLDFLRVGSDIIETNTYQASIDGFMKYLGLTKDDSNKLIYKAVECAKRAVKTYLEEVKDNPNVPNPKPLIAGSCGPYGAALHDGSEYSGHYCSDISLKVLKDWHRPRISSLLDAGVDLLAFETLPCKEEAEVLIELLKEFPNAKAWMCFSCKDGKSLVDGTDFQELVMQCYKNALPGQIIGFGVNCIAPQYVTSLLKGINKENSTDFIPLVVYPNSGEKYTVTEGWKEDKECYPSHEFIYEWLNYGVKYIGGCCRTQATDIKIIRFEVDTWIKTQNSTTSSS
ncbi:PREDICTED: homocysteine S-methyltransferase 1-like [Polistes dominula]|uniref:Homocysteine S-methyltransferase 1-like n=1 Tax=Polistes dominula TaxID=743375 RepID=A0ABM1IB91_POLDO|nr:PREDICTED: homocysteine S-methyltransferase 1-like [Polistes dominula]